MTGILLDPFTHQVNHLAAARQEWELAMQEWHDGWKSYNYRDPESIAKQDAAQKRRDDAWARYWPLKRGY